MAKRLILHGVVQGVFCRYYCSETAKHLGLHGSASNLPDGTVEVLLDTDDNTRLEAFIQALKTNPYDIRFYGSISTVDISDYHGTIRGDYRF
ncbi:MAG TPA: acylphosphatase [Spirochaetota bacterium]|nr:acylphosphatase [Spirochaetota bacterium]HQG43435.1 acylphosphatase [Spirochaetota bacterium]HQG43483.1 acylphosphatase [Spirochaetota bacterium]